MGVLRRRRDDEDATGHLYVMRERLLDIGDDYWIESAAGRREFKVNGEAIRVRDTFIIEDPQGQELAKIQERKVRVRDAMTIHLGDRKAVVKKAMIGLRDRYQVEVEGASDLKIHGNLVDHEYEIEGDGDKVAEVSKRWLRARDTYGVEVEPGTDPVLVLAVTVAVDAMTRT